MSLLQLPPETLTQIFDDIGSSYFRSDLSRLTVCKQWSKFAHTACYRDSYFTQKTLKRLRSSPYTDSSLSLVKDSMETLDLNLNDIEGCDSIRLLSSKLRVMNDPVVPLAICSDWRRDLNDDLSYFATIIEQSRKLRILRIQANNELHLAYCFQMHNNYLFSPTLRGFLSTSNLTSLELDICGTELVPYQFQEHSEGLHVCTSIAVPLTTLRRLRLRMRSICSDVLKPRQNNTNLRLNEVLINLSLFNSPPLTTLAVHATCCDLSPGGIVQLKGEMEKQAQLLVTHMAAPKIVRILTHALPSFRKQAFDVLTGKVIKLSKGAEWDDDGEAMEDDISEEESDISSLSSYGDL
ncbi:hypothetical protein B0J11DRAFT_510808 [Dendryphion nanum]|uniref:F-box domain-containing protein n=1 Tax=Dendryphion nanum TaxID=256645 RepID=A0A9P9D9F1_9PLEO|nr:hypothetical protein B0J11DRAFT_510808 [Dendryphion nanum]